VANIKLERGRERESGKERGGGGEREREANVKLEKMLESLIPS
jgi:hypothetical protein